MMSFSFDPLALARALHVLGVVIWIGGVAFVTTSLIPALRETSKAEERMALFETIERRFAAQARIATLLVGITGFYIVETWKLWDRFAQPGYWWMHAMLAVWTLFSVMLFVAEPLFLHRWFKRAAQQNPESTFQRIQTLHRILLAVSLITVAGAVAGSHGA